MNEDGEHMKESKATKGNLKNGTMMVQEDVLPPNITPDVETEPYLKGWRSIKALDTFSLRDMLHALGWNLFFFAGDVNALAFGSGENSLRNAVQRITAKVSRLELNCLELTQLHRKHFLGLPYITVSAHCYQVQQSCQLETLDERRRLRRSEAWARG